MNAKDGQNDGYSITHDPPFGSPLMFQQTRAVDDMLAKPIGALDMLTSEFKKNGTSKQSARTAGRCEDDSGGSRQAS